MDRWIDGSIVPILFLTWRLCVRRLGVVGNSSRGAIAIDVLLLDLVGYLNRTDSFHIEVLYYFNDVIN